MTKAQKRKSLTVKFLKDRNLKDTPENVFALAGTDLGWELEQIFKRNGCTISMRNHKKQQMIAV